MKKLRNKILSAVLVLSLLLTSSSFAFAVGEDSTAEENIVQIPQEQLKIAGFSSQQYGVGDTSNEESKNEGPANNAIDGNIGTFWHTIWTGTDPETNVNANEDTKKYIIIDLGSNVYLKKFKLIPRQNSTENVRIRDYKIYTTIDFDTENQTPSFSETPVLEGSFYPNAGNNDGNFVEFKEPVLTRYIKIQATDSNKYATIAELNFFMDSNYNPTIVEQPKSAVYSPADDIKALNVSANSAGDNGVEYQWYKSDTDGYTGTEILGATNSDYQPEDLEKDTTKYYYVKITDKDTGAYVYSDIVFVSIHTNSENEIALANGKYYNTLSTAINEAQTGSTIWILKDIDLTSNISINKEITIKSVDNLIRTTQPFTIKRTSGNSGAMFTVKTNGNLTLDNIIVDGGAVWGEGNTAATASGNSGIKGGALVKVENNGDLTVKADATLQNNENISSAGGAISADADGSNYSNIHVYGKILNNKVIEFQWNNGGGIASDGDLYIYEGAVISGNFAPQSNEGGEGGGIQIFQAGSLYLYGGTIKDNRAGQCNNISFGNGDSARKRPVQLMGNVEIESINLKNKNAADTNKTIEVVGELSGSINVILGNGVDGDTIATINENVSKENILSVFKVNDKITYLSGNEVKFGTEANYSTNLASEKSVVANPDGSASTTLTVETTGTDVTYKWYSCDADGSNSQLVEDQTNNTLTLDNLTIGSTYYYCEINNGDESTAEPKTSTICEVKVTDFYPCSKAIDKFKNV